MGNSKSFITLLCRFASVMYEPRQNFFSHVFVRNPPSIIADLEREPFSRTKLKKPENT